METKQKECEICGVWFTPSRSSQKYCPECGKDYTKSWRDLHKHMQYSVARVGTGRPVSKTEVECKYCHKTFTCYNGVPQILPNHSPITDASSALTENVSAMNGTIPVNASTPASTAATIFFFMSKLLFFLI